MKPSLKIPRAACKEAVMLAIEWGYKQCEKGLSLQEALLKFEQLMREEDGE